MKKLAWIIHCILVPMEYSKDQAGNLMVREWLERPVNLINHLRTDHQLSEADINEILLALRSGKKLKHTGAYLYDFFNF